jgi:Skp family chaperone for outer membrane proteins
MRKSFFLSLSLAVLLLGTAGAAQAAKIGVFNSRALASQCEPFLQAQTNLESQFANEKAGLERTGADLEQQAQTLQSQQAVLSPEAWEDARIKFNRSKRDFEDRYQAYMRKSEAALMRLQQDFMNALFKAAQEYGTANSYDILLDSAMGGPIYYNKDADVTEPMLAEVTRAYRAGAR